jgi:hypothetical protein
MKQRLTTCVLFGVLVAAVLAWFSATHRHAGLVAAAAKSHQTTGAYLAGVSGGVAFTVAVVAFIVTSILAAARKRPRTERPRQSARGRRGDRGAGYHPGPGWSEW